MEFVLMISRIRYFSWCRAHSSTPKKLIKDWAIRCNAPWTLIWWNPGNFLCNIICIHVLYVHLEDKLKGNLKHLASEFVMHCCINGIKLYMTGLTIYEMFIMPVPCAIGCLGAGSSKISNIPHGITSPLVKKCCLSCIPLGVWFSHFEESYTLRCLV